MGNTDGSGGQTSRLGPRKVCIKRREGIAGEKPAVAELGTVALRGKPQLWAGYFHGMPMNWIKDRGPQAKRERDQKKTPPESTSQYIKRVKE